MDKTTNKKLILFVDDEQKVLEALRRTLASMRNEWEMVFVTSGHEALQIMAQRQFDVIVSDMRMPVMDGAQLLNAAKERFPSVVRFVLSGYIPTETILKTIDSADQFFSKPCDPELLKSAIKGALEAQKIIISTELRSAISSIRALPTLPKLYIQLIETVNSPKSSFKDIADIIRRDPTVTAKVLQLVNSAFFGLRHHVENMQHAVTILGIDTLKAVVLTTETFSTFSQLEIDTFHIEELYDHSFVIGALARSMAETISKDRSLIDSVGMAGILHDIGKVILIRNKPIEYERVFKMQHDRNVPFYVLEKDSLGISHAEIGGYLLSVWGLPEAIIKAVLFHCEPYRLEETACNEATLIYIANKLYEKLNREDKGNENLNIDEKYLAKLGLTKFIPQWLELCSIRMKSAKEEENKDR